MKNKLYRLTVLGIEQTLKMKFFVILNILMLIAIIGFVNFGSLKQIFSNVSGSKLDDNIIKVMVNDETNKFVKIMKDNDIKDITIENYSQEGVNEGKVLIEIKKDDSNIINVKITSNKYIDGSKYLDIKNVVNKVRNEVFAEKHGIKVGEVQQLSSDVNIERVVLTINDTDYVKYESVITFIPFIMYMLFIFVAATISSTIGIEKISKTTEYMLTGMSEKAYLWYNILQVNIVFIIQMILSGLYYILANLINNLINIKFLGVSVSGIGNISNLNIDPILFKIILLTIVQTVICVLILSIIQAIMTSKVNNMTDISNSTMLVIMIIILVCFVCPNIINVSETVNIFIKIISCLPVLSVVMVPKLILLHQIGNIGIIIAILGNVFTLFILSIFGYKWFKKGLLDSGNSNKTDKRKKDEIYDMNKSKFKEVIFKISIAMLMYLVVSNILGIIGMLINGTIITNKNIQSIINIIVWILSILPSYLYLSSSYEMKSINKTNRINQDKVSIKDAINWIIMGTFIVSCIQFIVSIFTNDNSGVDIAKLVGADFTSITGIILFIIQISILPAIFEELLFRKAMLKTLNKYGNTVSIIITSFCFGLMHQNVTQGIFAFLMGIVLSFITLKTKSIIPAMIIHFLNNFTAVISIILIKLNYNEIMNNLSLVLISLILISAICLIVNLIKNRNVFKIEENGIKINSVLSSIFTQYIVVITLILYIIITIYVQMVLI